MQSVQIVKNELGGGSVTLHSQLHRNWGVVGHNIGSRGTRVWTPTTPSIRTMNAEINTKLQTAIDKQYDKLLINSNIEADEH